MTKPKTKPMLPDWKARLAEQNARYLARRPQLEGLRTKLLTYGGEEVCLVFEPNLRKLLRRGILFGRTSKRMPGEPSSCHSNTVALYLANKGKVKIATGYTLSSDGVWRQHSWGVVKRRRTIETTTSRLRYFGFVLTEEEVKGARIRGDSRLNPLHH